MEEQRNEIVQPNNPRRKKRSKMQIFKAETSEDNDLH